MATVKRICVYCGSSGNVAAEYRAGAGELGRRLAGAGIELVYGGGRIGLMGLLADAMIGAGGRVTGIIPAHLHAFEIGHSGVDELIVVANMHERKQMMFERADAFAILPGGLGTLDEAFEIITWRQLGLHDKPVLILDIACYWQPLRALVEHVIAEGFARPGVRGLFEFVPSVDALIQALARSREPALAPEPKLI